MSDLDLTDLLPQLDEEFSRSVADCAKMDADWTYDAMADRILRKNRDLASVILARALKAAPNAFMQLEGLPDEHTRPDPSAIGATFHNNHFSLSVSREEGLPDYNYPMDIPGNQLKRADLRMIVNMKRRLRKHTPDSNVDWAVTMALMEIIESWGAPCHDGITLDYMVVADLFEMMKDIARFASVFLSRDLGEPGEKLNF